MLKHMLRAGVVLLLVNVCVLAGAQAGKTTTTATTKRVFVRRAWKMTPEQEKATLAFLQEYFPDDYDNALRLQTADRRAYERLMRARWWFSQNLKRYPQDMRGAYIEQYRTTAEIWRICRKLPEVRDDARRQALESQLSEAAVRLFDAEQVIRRYRLTQLAERLVQLRKELKRRADERDQEIPKLLQRYKDLANRYHKKIQTPRKRAPTTRPSGTP